MNAPAKVPLYDPRVDEDGVPHGFFDELRRTAPVYWQPEAPPSKGFWAVTRYDDVMQVSRDPRPFSSEAGTSSLTDFFDDDALEIVRALMVNMDAPKHTRQRNLVNRGFMPRMINRLEAHIREICGSLVDKVIARDEVDFVDEIAAPLPQAVIAELKLHTAPSPGS